MSKVISFRLDTGNPRERQALKILNIWYAEGYSVRHVITEALIKLNGTGSKQTAMGTQFSKPR